MLTDKTCKTAKARDRGYKLSDHGGLFLFISKTGFKSWRLKYRYANSEKLLTIGPYPEVSLLQAREEREKAKKLLREGVDPSQHKKKRSASLLDASAANSFRAIALDWHGSAVTGWSPYYAAQAMRILNKDVFPAIGSMPVSEIDTPLILQILRKIEQRGSQTIANLARIHISGIFTHAIYMGVCATNPAALVGRALRQHTTVNVPAITNIRAATKFLQEVEAQPTASVTLKLMSRLIALTAVRTSVARLAEYTEFSGLDTEQPMWKIPAQKMKLSASKKNNSAFDFSVPLSRQSVEVIKAAMSISGDGTLVFPSTRFLDKPYGNGSLSPLYRSINSTTMLVPHGWRATFSTIMNERAAKAGRDSDRPIIDMMLAHMTNTVEVTYNRAAYMQRRREIAQEWADLLTDGLLPAIELLPR